MFKWPWVPRDWWEDERYMAKKWEEWYWQAERQKDALLEQIEEMEKRRCELKSR